MLAQVGRIQPASPLPLSSEMPPFLPISKTLSKLKRKPSDLKIRNREFGSSTKARKFSINDPRSAKYREL